MSPPNDSGRQSGCLLKILIGCGVLVLLAVLLMVAGWLWLSTPGKQIDTAAIQGETSLGTMEVGDLLEDEGFGALVENVVNEINRRNDQALPAWFPRRRSKVEDMGMVVPKSATVTFEDVAQEGRPRFVAAINLRGWVRPIRWMFDFMGGGDKDMRTYRGYRVISADDKALMTFHESTILVSDHPDALFRVIDRLVDGTGIGIPPLPEGAIPTGVWDATGGMRNDDGRLDQLLADLHADGTAIDTLGPDATLGFGVDVVTADRILLRVDLAVAGTAETDLAALHMTALVARAKERLEDKDLPTTGTWRAEGTRVIGELEILGVQDALIGGFEELDGFDASFEVEPHRPDDPPATDPAPTP